MNDTIKKLYIKFDVLIFYCYLYIVEIQKET